MNNLELIKKSKLPSFMIGSYQIVSQQPLSITPADREISATCYLPQFIQLWHDLEKVTGFRWKCTSYIRNSPSHKKGHSFDLAPAIAKHAEKHYAVNNGSDPVLYKREPLIRALQSLKDRDYGAGRNHVGIFIEPDHLHVQILAPKPGQDPTSTVKWKIPKPIYSDTESRMNLPLTKNGYLPI